MNPMAMVGVLRFVKVALTVITTAPLAPVMFHPDRGLKPRILLAKDLTFYQRLMSLQSHANGRIDWVCLTDMIDCALFALEGAESLDGIIGEQLDPEWPDDFLNALAEYRAMKAVSNVEQG